jgi:hypothetical protein
MAVLEHLESLGLASEVGTRREDVLSKDVIRAYHRLQREEYRAGEQKFVTGQGLKLVRRHFAEGQDVIPDEVHPVMSVVQSDTEDANLFRLATLLWSVPVSRGYGRRMRFLVRDRSNGKLMGIFALGDPVFNIHARDEWIGWSSDDRKQRLVSVMDAHIVGAVPPYNQLLGGKVVASLMTSDEVCQAFTQKYGDTRGEISREFKHAQLVLITVTSALGRSSLYNRLRIPGVVAFERVGMTEGWGHFQIPNVLFLKMRQLLRLRNHRYWWQHRFGMGPNWRMRVIRAALEDVGLASDLLQHGIRREIFAAPLGADWREFLRGKAKTCIVKRPSAEEIGSSAVRRWLIPRSLRRPDFRDWTQADTWELLTGRRDFLV